MLIDVMKGQLTGRCCVPEYESQHWTVAQPRDDLAATLAAPAPLCPGPHPRITPRTSYKQQPWNNQGNLLNKYAFNSLSPIYEVKRIHTKSTTLNFIWFATFLYRYLSSGEGYFCLYDTWNHHQHIIPPTTWYGSLRRGVGLQTGTLVQCRIATSYLF